jgi:hypothetical protein
LAAFLHHLLQHMQSRGIQMPDATQRAAST